MTSRKTFLCFMFVAAHHLAFTQGGTDETLQYDVLFTWEGDMSLYRSHGIMIYVSNEDGQPTLDGLFFTVKNSTDKEACYLAKVNANYVNPNDPNRLVIHTTSNITTCYPIPPGSKQTVRVVQYQQQNDIGRKTHVELTLRIAKEKSVSADLSEWYRVFERQESQPAQAYQGDDKIFYQGPNDKWVNLLLSRVKGWRTPRSLGTNDGVVPVVEQDCMRDQYVAAAVNYAWAAEGYHRLGNSARSSEMAAEVLKQLANAAQLCSDRSTAGSAGAYTCPTERIASCAEIGVLASQAGSSGPQSEPTDQTVLTPLQQGLMELIPHLIEEDGPSTIAGGTMAATAPSMSPSAAQTMAAHAQATEISNLAWQVIGPKQRAAAEAHQDLVTDIREKNQYFKKKYGYSLEDYTRMIIDSKLDSLRHLFSIGFPKDANVVDTGRVRFTRRLIKEGIHLAAERNNVGVVAFLVEEIGINEERPTKGGGTDGMVNRANVEPTSSPYECHAAMRPISYAAVNGSMEVVRYLLGRGVKAKLMQWCDCDCPNKTKYWFVHLWDLAEAGGHNQLAELLRSYQ